MIWIDSGVRRYRLIGQKTTNFKASNQNFYRGSNAEYLVFKTNGGRIGFEEYKARVLPVLNKAFPRFDESIDDDELKRLNENETSEIKRQLDEIGYRAVAIPKTLYDLLGYYFMLKDVLKSKGVDEPTLPRKKFLAKAGLKSIVPNINPRCLNILNDLKKREFHDDYVKSECYFNNRMLKFIDKHVDQAETLTFKKLRKIFDNVFNNLNKFKENNPLDCFSVKFTRDFFKYRLTPKFMALTLKALKHEFQQDSPQYTVYRAGSLKLLEEEKSQVPYSASFGHSPLMGVVYDGDDGCVFGLHISWDLVYAVDINKADYHDSSSLVSKVFFIPPLRRINRLTVFGEFGHVRTKVFSQGQHTGICGIFDKDIGPEINGHPLQTCINAFQDINDFKKKGSDLLEKLAVAIAPMDHS